MPSSHRRRGQDKTVLSCPRLRCERVCKLVLTQFRNMTSQFADTANGVIKRPNGNYRIQYYEQLTLKQPRLPFVRFTHTQFTSCVYLYASMTS